MASEPGGMYRKGLALALLAALISGVSVFVNGEAVKLADPSVYTAMKNIGSLVFLGAVVLAFNEWHRFRSLAPRQWAKLAMVGLIGGSVPFLLFFSGLSMGGAAVSSFIYRSLFIFAGISGYVFLKEKPEAKDLVAGFVMLMGNAFLVSGGFAFGPGQLFVLGATVLWALEYTLSRKLLAEVHPRVVMVSRMLFGSVILLGALAALGSLDAIPSIDAQGALWLVITSSLLAGFLLAWYSSLRYLPLLKATSVLALGGIVTAALDLAFAGKALSPSDALGLGLILLGGAIIAGLSDLMRSASEAKKAVPGLVR